MQCDRADVRASFHYGQLCQPQGQGNTPRDQPAASLCASLSLCVAPRYRKVFSRHRPRDPAPLLSNVVTDDNTLALIARIIASGDGVLEQEYQPTLFEGDDLLALCRPRGLPIGNLTSQFWANCYLHSLGLFIKRELRWPAYLRYVDDMALFGDDKRSLWLAKQAIVQRLAALRLNIHEHNAQVAPVRHGVPWLGFVVFPDHRRIKARKVVSATRRLGARYRAWQSGVISFAEFDASVQGWINHVRYADSWGLREHLLDRFDLSGRPLR